MTQVTKIRNESGGITADSTEIKKSIREYYECMQKKLDSLDEMIKSQSNRKSEQTCRQ